MAIEPFAAAIFGNTASAGDFIAKILKASTEHSITGKSLDRAKLRNGGSATPAFFPDFPGIMEQARRIRRVSAQYPSPLRAIFSGMR